MDPVSVFKALYDTKCIKFGRYDLKSGIVTPYYINLSRLPLYPALMEAIVTQVHEKFLTKQALASTMSQMRRKSRQRANSTASQSLRSARSQLVARNTYHKKDEVDDEQLVRDKLSAIDVSTTDSDSQLGEEDLSTSSGEDCDWDSIDSAASLNMDPIISGVPYGAIPLAVAVSYKTKFPYLYERQGTKSHGDQQPLMEDFNSRTRAAGSCRGPSRKSSETSEISEISLGEEQRVILVEDVLSSGESILETVKQLEKQNLKVEFVVCIIDREENGINLLLEQAGIHVVSLYKMSAILRVLETTGRISSDQFLSTRKWIVDNQFKSIGVDPSKATTASAIYASNTCNNSITSSNTNRMPSIVQN